MKKAALFFDIDGTILSEETKEIPKSAIEALLEVKKKGHLLFINTGRTMCSIPAELKQFAFDGYLCGCGTYLAYHDEVLFTRSIEKKRGREILNKMAECNLDGIAEGTEDIYLPERISRFERLETSRRYFHSSGLGRECYLEKDDFIYDKVFIYADERSNLSEFFSFIETDMEAIDRGGNAYEIIQKGYSKGTACDMILKKFGLELDQAYVFGDSMNDLSMFQYAAHTIAMGNHAKGLEPFTEYVTAEVEKGGIAQAIRHYGLDGRGGQDTK